MTELTSPDAALNKRTTSSSSNTSARRPKLLAISTLDLLRFAMAHPQRKVLAIQERGQGQSSWLFCSSLSSAQFWFGG